MIKIFHHLGYELSCIICPLVANSVVGNFKHYTWLIDYEPCPCTW